MDAIGNMLGGMIADDLDRIASEMICTSANYMSLAAANEEIPIPQVPLGPSLDWSSLFGGLDIGGLLGGLTGEPSGGLPGELDPNNFGGQMWRSNGDSFNFTFTPAMMDFRKQILERAFGPDMLEQPLRDQMMEPLVPKLMCAISEGTRKCKCSNKYDFKDEGIGFLNTFVAFSGTANNVRFNQ